MKFFALLYRANAFLGFVCNAYRLTHHRSNGRYKARETLQ